MSPPRWAQRFVEWYCRTNLAEDLLGDLNEYFERNLKSKGPFRAKLIYIVDAFKFLRPYTIKKLSFLQLLINYLMIGSYIKTSGRNLMRNKLFSSINVIGLAISMSVGLLMISFVHDLLSYDKFHKNGDRIYRLLTQPDKNGDWGQFASTSIKMGRLVQEKITGIDAITILRRESEGDAIVGDKTLPLPHRLWADASFFKVFTFPMVSGDPVTALSQPYSMVITEQTARKLFGDQEAIGKTVRFDTLDYQITGVVKDVPDFSHLRFDALLSFSTLDQLRKDNRDFLSWQSVWSNYVYMLMPQNADLAGIQSQLDQIAKEENSGDPNNWREFELQRLYDIALGKDLSNSIGPNMSISVVWIVTGLSFVVILSACFNYTNLSIARSIRRFKEVGLRKVIGAGRSQVRMQFLAESVIVSLLALLISFLMFLALREQFIAMAPEMQNMVKLELTPAMLAWFIVFSITVGVLAGVLPALLFAKVSIINALKDASSVKVFKHVSLRRGLVVVQYTLTLVFITATFIGFKQYKSFLAFDLGFNTENILNITLQGNNSDILVKELSEFPEVKGISKSLIISSIGNYWGGHVKYKNMSDSSLIWYNKVDENYLALHEYQLIAGQNFIARPTTKEAATEVIVNEMTLKKLEMNPADPSASLGEVIIVDGKKFSIVGVMKDVHYGKVDNPIEPVVFMYNVAEKHGFLNLKIQSDDPVALMGKIEQTWKKVDNVHPLSATFYKESIEEAYSEFSVMLKVIGFLAFLAISIASMGLFGMVVFTTETRLKEIGIRKVMGASSGNLILLLSRGFIWMLGISAAIALPATYIFFEQVVLTKFQFHSPIGVVELFIGLGGVLVIAFIMIGSQTLKAARTNPAEVLKSE